MIKRKRNYNAGFTYVELIVVLGIFAVMTSVVIFDYNKFEDQVNIKVLANDIASRIAEAQNSAVSGLNPNGIFISPTKPAYGIYFDTTNTTTSENFTHFADLNNAGYYESSSDSILDNTAITNGNFIKSVAVTGTGCPAITNLSIVFKRPDSSALITSTPALTCTVTYAQIEISSLSGLTSCIQVYPSGRIQIAQCSS
jgi:Tfp pilus assembly protein FimT